MRGRAFLWLTLLIVAFDSTQAVKYDCCGALGHYLDAADAAFAELDAMLLCQDKNDGCAAWARGGECTRNPGFMHDTCRLSCQRCALAATDLRDAHEIALLAMRNIDLACTAAASASLPMCNGAKNEVAILRSVSGMDEQTLHGLLMAHKNQLKLVCPGGTAAYDKCALGHTPARALPIELQEAVGGARSATPTPEQQRATREVVLKGDGDVRMPTIALGTWLTVGDECTRMVTAALEAGFRAIDTSENYANHEAIGKALAASSVPRSELFLADKISLPQSYSAKGVRFAVAQSLASLGTSYLDLLMLHSIGPSREARNEAWAEMVKLKEEGVVRAIGTSNFGTREMAELRADAPQGHPPVTHQIKYNPYHPGRTGNANGEDFGADCRAHGCHIVAYCPLNAWPSKLAPIHDGHVAAIAKRHGRTPAQVLLRWVVQRGHAVLTRSSKAARLREALEVFEFELSPADMTVLSGLAWLVESELHRPPAGVLDTFGAVTPRANVEDRVEL